IPDYCEYTLLTYSYKILAKDNRGNRSLKSERGLLTGYNQECGPETEDLIESENNILPDMFSITNYPNPFNPTTNIKFDLPKDVLVSIKIFDMLGREIRTLVNDYKTAGSYTISFNGSDLSSGIYYFKIKAEDFEQVRKMMLLK
ncbi:MAG TPA: T9SS type A sorting domain-containing protein, partial [Ignavibacteria bacterium]|nr:T9SS type A sorting domain-containing protein [Ignavibacteria bacterium]